MALSQEQLAHRMKGIGSSDVPALMGHDNYRSCADLYLEKTARLEPFKGNDATKRGEYLEEPLLRFAEDALGCAIERNLTFLDPNGGPLAANLDGLARELNANVEGKSINGFVAEKDDFGEPWTDQVPPRIILQTHAAMYCAGLSISYVPVVLPVFKNIEFRMYVIKRDDAIVDSMRAAAADLWKRVTDFREQGIDNPPANSEISADVVKRIKREPNTWATGSDELMDRWNAAKAHATEAAKEAKALQTQILASMVPVTADGIVTESGRRWQYAEVHRKGFTVEATTYRQLNAFKEKK